MSETKTLVNQKIKSVKKGVSSGKDKYGKSWTLHIVRIEDSDWAEVDLSFFERESTKVLPDEGKEYDAIEVDETDKGYQIKKLVPKGEKPKPNKAKTESQATNATRWKGLQDEYTDWVKDPRFADSTFADYIAWKANSKSFYYRYGSDIVIKLLELAVLKPEKEIIRANVVYYAEGLYKCSTGDKQALAKAREICQANGHTGTEERSSNTRRSRKPQGKSREEKEPEPESGDDEGPGPDDITEEKAGKLTEKWIKHFKEIDNLPHLKNWMHRALESEDVNFIIKYYDGLWNNVMEAFNKRHDEIREELKKQKERENPEDISF